MCNYFQSGIKYYNLRSAMEKPEEVDKKLEKEIELVRIIGPFKVPPFKHFHLSPISIFEKKEPNAYKMIHHLSFP